MLKSVFPLSAEIIEMPTVRVNVDALTQIRVNPALISLLAAASKAA